VDSAKGKANFQLRLPLPELMEDMTGLIEQTCSQVGLLMIKGLIDEEVESLVGGRYAHDDQRQGYRWGTEEGSVIFAGRKVAIDRPRVRSKGGGEIPLQRYAAFRKPAHMEKSVQQRILRCVSMRDYEGVLEPLCDGYGIDKSSVSRHWKAASAKQMRQLMERPLGDLSIDVLMLDGKGFGDYTVITALGIDTEGRKHVLGLWSGATENAVVCGQLLDELIERGLPADQAYLFVLDGSAALSKAVKARFGERAILTNALAARIDAKQATG
jgi:transposase-like protein